VTINPSQQRGSFLCFKKISRSAHPSGGSSISPCRNYNLRSVHR
jgi:hypothetical protein